MNFIFQLNFMSKHHQTNHYSFFPSNNKVALILIDLLTLHNNKVNKINVELQRYNLPHRKPTMQIR